MLFPTLAFHVFFVCVFALAWVLKGSNEWRKIMLLVASWIFYGAWDWRFVAMLILSGLLNWGAARVILGAEGHEPTRQALLAVGVVFNLVLLSLFKYYNFFIEQAGALLALLGWHRDLPVLEVVL